ncbi:MAG: hypothetical protein N4A33_09080 [Bacteriovoracaceae bacterium]|jgi:hypothetical protein|nr:hypothetical protein [Bacteriovoracaceae bacterium]
MKLILLLLFLFSFSVFSQKYSMRDCMLLPITDTAGEVIGYKVYDEVENYLRRTNWCSYKSSSKMLTIFSKYREKLKGHLEDPDVLKTVANRLNVGTLIKLDLIFVNNSVNLSLEVRGQNGVDTYFKERAQVGVTVEEISTKIIDWLEIYSKSIPYESKVIGILGDQVTFKSYVGFEINQEFEIRRYTKTRKHRLLGTIVQWDSVLIGKGKIFSIKDGEALGVITGYYSERKPVSGDWINIDIKDLKKISDKRFFKKFEKGDYGKLGEGTIYITASNSSVTTKPVGNNIKYGGIVYGIQAEGEAWITRDYFAIGEISKSVGGLVREGGISSEKSPSTINGTFKLGAGYKYLPMGFFFGPRINLYGGYARYSYGVDESSTDGIGEGLLSGLFIGAGIDTPLRKGVRAFGSIEYIPFSSFSDEDGVYSSVDKSHHFRAEAGAKYKYNRQFDLKGALEIINANASFSSGVSNVKYKDIKLKLGASFLF